jgi:hypothetical protein
MAGRIPPPIAADPDNRRLAKGHLLPNRLRRQLDGRQLDFNR